MKKLTSVILGATLLMGCASYTTKQTDMSYEKGQPSREITTYVTVSTLFDSTSKLATSKATQTDKSQSSALGGLEQSASSTNAVQIMSSAQVKLVTFTSGLRLNLDFVTKISVSGTVITFNLFDGTAETLDVQSPEIVLSQLARFADALICNAVQSLTWTSITPNTGTAGVDITSFAIAGSGFLGSGINNIKADDGAGHSITWLGFLSVDSDISITLGDIGFPTGPSLPAATYLIYYSTDSGASWFDTGLTIIVS